MTTIEVCRMLDVTYRQLDYWSRQGWIPGQEGGVGSGHRRVWTSEQFERIQRLKRAADLRQGTLMDTVEALEAVG